ncbi:MAG TPA: rRNA maturation RNase YbeY [Thermoanaerobaculia bacterium]
MNVEISGAAIPRFSRREITAWTRRALRTLERGGHLHASIGEVAIAFVDDAAMAELNRTFRRKNRTTDVLTFPADESDADPESKSRPLGEIVISLDQAKRQARDERHSLPTELRYLILHGILHALGHDHETDQGEMNALELELRAKVGLA